MSFATARRFNTFSFASAALLGLGLLVSSDLGAQSLLYTAPGVGGENDIFLSGVNLTNSPGEDGEFHQSSDGECIVFTHVDAETGRSEIWLMDSDGSDKTRLSLPFAEDTVNEFSPRFSPDGTTIAFVREEGGDRTSIWLMDKDGSFPEPITPLGPYRYTRPRAHPLSGDLIFNCEFLGDDDDLSVELARRQSTGHTKDIIIWVAETGFTFLFFTAEMDNFDGEWSPDGSQMSFTVSDTNGTAIGVTNADGTNAQILTSSENLNSNTAWADNNTIVFESRRNVNPDIYSIIADGSGEQRLTDDPGNDTSPVGSRVSNAALATEQSVSRFLFLSDRTGVDNAYVMNIDGSGLTRLTITSSPVSEPQHFITPAPPAPPAINPGGVVLSTLLPTVSTVSPLSIISVFGSNFSTDTILFPTLDGNGDLDKILGTTCLEMNGERLPIFAVTPGQINAQASASMALGPASFTVITDCDTPIAAASEAVTLPARALFLTPQAASSDVEMATVEAATPGFFQFPPLKNDGLIAARFNVDNVAVAPSGMFTDQFGTSRPAEPGDIIVLYGTGWGESTAGLAAGELATAAAGLLPGANPVVTFGGVVVDPADIFYIGVTPGTAGLFQLGMRTPANAQAGNNEVVLTVYGKSTPVGPVVPVVLP